MCCAGLARHFAHAASHQVSHYTPFVHRLFQHLAEVGDRYAALDQEDSKSSATSSRDGTSADKAGSEDGEASAMELDKAQSRSADFLDQSVELGGSDSYLQVCLARTTCKGCVLLTCSAEQAEQCQSPAQRGGQGAQGAQGDGNGRNSQQATEPSDHRRPRRSLSPRRSALPMHLAQKGLHAKEFCNLATPRMESCKLVKSYQVMRHNALCQPLKE